MIRNIINININDLAIAAKNKTFYLILLIPLFIFISLKLVDKTDGVFEIANIGVIHTEMYAPVILQTIKSAERVFKIFVFRMKMKGLMVEGKTN